MIRLLAILALWAFAADECIGPSENPSAPVRAPSSMWAPVVWTDPDTGCQYLLASNGAASPRLGATGRPICRGTQ